MEAQILNRDILKLRLHHVDGTVTELPVNVKEQPHVLDASIIVHEGRTYMYAVNSLGYIYGTARFNEVNAPLDTSTLVIADA